MLFAFSGQIANNFKIYARSDLPPLRAAALAKFINNLIFPAVDLIKFETTLL